MHGPRRALIERVDNLIRITPAYKSLLAPMLFYNRREQKGASKSSVIYTPVYLFREQEIDWEGGKQSALIVPAGLTIRVVGHLQQAGIPVEYKDLRIPRLGEPVFENLEPSRELQDGAIATMVANDMCQIEAPTGMGKSWIIRQIPNLWPDAKIIITSPYTAIIQDTYANIREKFPADQVGMIGNGYNEMGRRITCALSQSLHKCDLQNCDIFVFDEVHRAASPETAEKISAIPNARMYGFSANTTGRSDKADLETEAMFGPVLFKLTYQQVQETGNIVPMKVFVMPANHLSAPNCTINTLDRWGLWRNDERNKLFAEGVGLLRKQFGDDIQILLTVTTVEHAVNLGQYLPDFQLVYAQMDGDKRLRYEREGLIPEGTHPITKEQKDQFRIDFASGKLRRVIATGIWSTGVNFPNLNCVGRADGQGGEIANTQLPGRATRKTADKEFGIILDCNDAFHTTLANRYKKRMACYRKKGWDVQLLKPIPEYLK